MRISDWSSDVCSSDLMDGFVDQLVEIFRDLKATCTKPFVVCWVAAPEAGLKAFRELGITVLRGAEPTIDAVAGMVRYVHAQEAWRADAAAREAIALRSEEHTSELQSLMRISYAVFCLKKK